MAVVAVALAFVLASRDSQAEPWPPTAADLAAERLPETTADQAAALADGEVSRAEYEAAVAATIACLAEQGFVVDGPRDTGDRRLEFVFATADREEGVRYRAAYQECHVAHQRDIDLVWSKQLAEAAPPPPADAVDAARATLAACLVERGIEVSLDDRLIEMEAAVEAAEGETATFYKCVGEAQRTHGVLPGD